MPTKFLSRLLQAAVLLALGLTNAAARQVTPSGADKLLPESLGDFRAQSAPRGASLDFGQLKPEDFDILSASARDYVAPAGARLRVSLVQTRSTAAAYSLLTYPSGDGASPRAALLEGLDVVGAREADRLRFIRGTTFVEISGQGKADDEAATALARLLSEKLESAESEVPVLLAHLPAEGRAEGTTGYAVSLPVLQSLAGRQPVLDALTFEGGAEAATARYGPARLVIVEHTTPQYASENDARVKARLDELRRGGQPVPTLYKRTGNYSVFVFDAPDETAAAQLADTVKYEKDVRWLDRNPHMLERAQQAYGQMTGSVILTSLKITALSILLCLGVGGIFGSAVFLYRRAQSATTEVYSDAGGMVRLNIDDMTAETDPAHLLGTGERS